MRILSPLMSEINLHPLGIFSDFRVPLKIKEKKINYTIYMYRLHTTLNVYSFNRLNSGNLYIMIHLIHEGSFIIVKQKW